MLQIITEYQARPPLFIFT